MSRDVFIKGALILTAAGILVKIIGSANRIFLSRLLGGEGIGLYQMAYPIYMLALSISSAGIPVAISIIVAERAAVSDFRGAARVFHISLYLLIATGLAFSLLLYFSAGWLIETRIVRDVRAYYALAALAPAIFFVTIMSSYRGYFQGLQLMLPTAASQAVEQFVRVFTMLGFAYLLLPRGLEYAAAGASFGAAPGAAAGLLVLLECYRRHRPLLKQQIEHQPLMAGPTLGGVVRRIIRLALPVSLANIMLPIVSNIDLLIVPPRLELAGYSIEQATEQFGYLTGMATPLVHLVTILTVSLGASLVPAVSSSAALGDGEAIHRRTSTAIRLANLITIPSAVGMWLLASPISLLLYGTPDAGSSIAVLAPAAYLIGLQQVSTGALQGMGRTAIPVANMGIAALVKVVLSWELTAQPSMGIIGAGVASLADFGLAAALNLIFLYRLTGCGGGLRETLKCAVATAVMGVAVLFTYDEMMRFTLDNTVAAAVAIGAGCLTYGLAVIAVGGVTVEDVNKIPRVGASVAGFMGKLGWIRR